MNFHKEVHLQRMVNSYIKKECIKKKDLKILFNKE